LRILSFLPCLIGFVQEPTEMLRIPYGSLTSLAEFAANGGKFQYVEVEIIWKMKFPNSSINKHNLPFFQKLFMV
jgi:hypothetical protein